MFEKTKKNDGAKMYKLRVFVSHFIIFYDYKIAEGKLDVEITSKWINKIRIIFFSLKQNTILIQKYLNG